MFVCTSLRECDWSVIYILKFLRKYSTRNAFSLNCKYFAMCMHIYTAWLKFKATEKKCHSKIFKPVLELLDRIEKAWKYTLLHIIQIAWAVIFIWSYFYNVLKSFEAVHRVKSRKFGQFLKCLYFGPRPVNLLFENLLFDSVRPKYFQYFWTFWHFVCDFKLQPGSVKIQEKNECGKRANNCKVHASLNAWVKYNFVSSLCIYRTSYIDSHAFFKRTRIPIYRESMLHLREKMLLILAMLA